MPCFIYITWLSGEFRIYLCSNDWMSELFLDFILISSDLLTTRLFYIIPSHPCSPSITFENMENDMLSTPLLRSSSVFPYFLERYRQKQRETDQINSLTERADEWTERQEYKRWVENWDLEKEENRGKRGYRKRNLKERKMKTKIPGQNEIGRWNIKRRGTWTRERKRVTRTRNE